MGLPIWGSPAPEAQDGLKADLTANARSPIRRRRPTTSRLPALAEHNSTWFSRNEHWSVSRPSSSRARLPPPPVPESRNYLRASGPPVDPQSSSRTPFRVSTDVPRGLSFEDRQPLPALTPNFAPAAASRNARNTRHDSPHEIDAQDRSTRRSRSPWATRESSPYLPYTREHVLALTDPREDADDDSSDNAVSFDPFRRMGRRNIADGPLPTSALRESWSPVDGLGDRERSLSPVADHWEPMLSSVAPDPLPPTADSSFTSAAASASFSHPSSRAGSSNSNSASSSRTHLTVPSRRQSSAFDQFLRICDTTDDDSASETEAEEDIAETHAAPAHSTRRSGIRSTAMRNPYRYSRGLREQVRESTANVRSFYGEVTAREPQSQVEGPTEDRLDGSAEERNTTDEEMPLDQELRDARALLERLARRDDIGDDFWASVGLRRPLADRIERIQRSERL